MFKLIFFNKNKKTAEIYFNLYIASFFQFDFKGEYSIFCLKNSFFNCSFFKGKSLKKLEKSLRKKISNIFNPRRETNKFGRENHFKIIYYI